MSDQSRRAQLLLTGVTGFVGKVVLEELTRRKAELQIETIYVLIRSGRKGANAEARFREEVVASACFSGLDSGWEKDIRVIAADLTTLELEPRLKQELHGNLTHIIHCAASVAFDLPVQEAAEANITSALKLMALAQGCQKLVSFVDVSTAYVSPHQSNQQAIPEALVPLPIDPETLYQGILDGSLEEKALLKQLGHPNTYTLTKCLSEHLLERHKGNVPLAIVRPSIISASWQYPRPGWIDSYAAFAGFVGLIGAGLLKCVVAKDETVLDIVPCDQVSHRIIETSFSPSAERPLVQHIVSGVDLGCRADSCISGIESYFQRHPVQFWPKVARISNGSSITFDHWRHHTLPTVLAGTWFGLLGKHRQRRQSQKVLERMQYLNDVFPYFTHNTFRFESATPMAIKGFEPKQYIERVCQGVHTHLMRANRAEMLLGGTEHRHPKSDLRWARQQPVGNWAIRTAAYVVRKGLRKSNDKITFDRESFEQALLQVPADSLLMLVPSHRSYMDFLLCSYLIFAHPELNISIPRIAAASDFAKLPLLGWFFQQTHAFYIQRGQGKADPALSRQIQALVKQNQSLEFFVEGTRSRSRQFLSPRRGVLRAIQGTGVHTTLLPIAISYDFVPEARSFMTELRGLGKSHMKMSTLLNWGRELLAGKVQLGRVHLTCGAPLAMHSETDIYALSRSIIGELQDKTAVSSLHLQSFLRHYPMPEIDLEWLQAAIEQRGGQVIESPLQDYQGVDKLTERTMRYHWMHYFYPDALALFDDHWVIASHIRENAYLDAWNQPAEQNPRQDSRLSALLKTLFEPIVSDYAKLAQLAQEKAALPRDMGKIVAENPEIFLPMAEDALREFERRNLMQLDAQGQNWVPGSNWAELEILHRACKCEDPLQKVKSA
jgi:alcohol-forming fatty acyl-CoA reductase